MSTRKVIDIKNKDGEKVYAKGHALATYTSEGLSVEESLLLLKSRLDEMEGGGGDVTVESDPLFTASPAANITDEDIASWNNKSDFSGSYEDLTDKPTIPAEQVNADWNATSGKAQILNKPTIPAAVTESTVSGWGFTKNTGTYSKPSDGIPRSDLASAVRTSLDKADTALQSYTEQYKGTVTGVRMNGTTKNPSSGVVDLGTVITAHQDLSGKQDKLISGTNIRTINGASILGSGDLPVDGGKEVVEAPVEYISGTYLILFATGMQAGKVYVAKHRVTGIQSLFFEEPLTDVVDYTLHFTTGDVATLDPFVFPSHLLWANGVVPTITPDTSYELSVTATMLDEEYVYKAVLTNFKTV